MSTCSIKIYRSHLTPARNALVDDIDIYLNSLTPTYSNDAFQYLKLGIDFKIKVNVDQKYASESIGNYVSIRQNDKDWYYFITEAEWKGVNTVELSLSIDSANTFRDDFTFSPKTSIIRQHKDRWQKLSEGEKLFPQTSVLPFEEGKEYWINKNSNLFNLTWQANGNYIRWTEYTIDEENNSVITETSPVSRIVFSADGSSIVKNITLYRRSGTADIFWKTVNYYAYQNGQDMWTIGIIQLEAWPQTVIGPVSSLLGGVVQDTTVSYVANIDREREQVDVVKYLHSRERIQAPGEELDWYLMYRTEIDPNDVYDKDTETYRKNPVECYTFANKDINIGIFAPGEATRIEATSLLEGQYYYILPEDNPTAEFQAFTDASELHQTFIDKSARLRTFKMEGPCMTTSTALVPATPGHGATSVTSDSLQTIKGCKFHRSGDEIIFETYSVGGTAWPGETWSGFPENGVWYAGRDRSGYKVSSPYIILTNLQKARITDDPNVPWEYAASTITEIHEFNIGSYTVQSVESFDTLDRTDNRIVKIIKLPYAPSTVNYQTITTNNLYSFGDEWSLEDGYMKLQNTSLSTVFDNEAFASIKLPFISNFVPSTTELRNSKYEPKIHSSEFSTYKVIYDSFVKEIYPENLSYDTKEISPDATTVNIPVSFHPTNTINSKFAFKIGMNDTPGVKYSDIEDYADYIIASRNNEETVFSNDYINYIRTGFNYDQKKMRNAETMSVVSTVLQVVGAVASFVSSIYTGTIGIAAGIALSTSSIASIANTANTFNSNKQATEAKLYELSQQSTSVAGADDVDLLSYYNGNKLEYLVYKPDEAHQRVLYDLFHYCGYAYIRTEVPNIHTRYWFNFIQCSPVFEDESLSPYNEFLNDIKSRYQAGITVYHRRNGTWNWNQDYENWEVSLL